MSFPCGNHLGDVLEHAWLQQGFNSPRLHFFAQGAWRKAQGAKRRGQSAESGRRWHGHLCPFFFIRFGIRVPRRRPPEMPALFGPEDSLVGESDL